MAEKFKDLKYLVQLLDDDDPEVYNVVRSEIKKYGEPVLPELKKAWNNAGSILLYNRIEQLIREINLDTYKAKFLNWLGSKDRSFINGVVLLNKMYNSDVSEKDIYDNLDGIVKDIWLELNNNLTPLEKINIVNHFLFSVSGFEIEKNVEEHNHFIYRALFYKKTNEISAAILYYYICEQLNIDVVPVMVNNRILLGYRSTDLFSGGTSKVIFLISPESRGSVFSAEAVDFSEGKPEDLIKYWLTAAIVMLKEKDDMFAAEYRSLLKNLIKAGV